MIISILNMDKTIQDSYFDMYFIDKTMSSEMVGVQFLKCLLKQQGGYYLKYTPDKIIPDYVVLINGGIIIAFAEIVGIKAIKKVVGEVEYKSMLEFGKAYLVRGNLKSSLVTKTDDKVFEVVGLQRPYIEWNKSICDFIEVLLLQGASISTIDFTEDIILKADIENVYQDKSCVCYVEGCSYIPFDSRRGVPYVEWHHFIPKKYESRLNKSLNVATNLIPLCPYHHRKIHLGDKPERTPIIESIYVKKTKDLVKAGFNISLPELIEFYDEFN